MVEQCINEILNVYNESLSERCKKAIVKRLESLGSGFVQNATNETVELTLFDHRVARGVGETILMEGHEEMMKGTILSMDEECEEPRIALGEYDDLGILGKGGMGEEMELGTWYPGIL